VQEIKTGLVEAALWDERQRQRRTPSNAAAGNILLGTAKRRRSFRELTRSMLLIDACSTRACSTNANASAVPFNKALLFFKQAKHRSHVEGFSQQYGVLLWRRMNLRWQAKDAGYAWVAYVVFWSVQLLPTDRGVLESDSMRGNRLNVRNSGACESFWKLGCWPDLYHV